MLLSSRKSQFYRETHLAHKPPVVAGLPRRSPLSYRLPNRPFASPLLAASCPLSFSPRPKPPLPAVAPVAPEGALRQHAQLSAATQPLLRGKRRGVSRPGCAGQLAVLRVFAHLPGRWWTQVLAVLLDFVAAQLGVAAGVFAAYDQREATVYSSNQERVNQTSIKKQGQ